MRPINIIAWIITVLSIVFLFYRLINVPKEIEYAQDSTLQIGYFAGLIFGIALLPGVVWIIVAVAKPPKPITDHAQSQKAFGVKSSNPEIIKLQNRLKNLLEEKRNINNILSDLKISQRQGILESSKFEKVYNEKYQELEFTKSEITKLNKRIRAIDLLKDRLKSLDKLVVQGIITASDRDLKKEELIEDMAQRIKG